MADSIRRRTWSGIRARFGMAALSLTVLSSTLLGQSGQPPSASQLLDRYDAREYEAVLRDLAGRPGSVGDFANELKRAAPAWIDRNGPGDVARRRLLVATLALEAARALRARGPVSFRDWQETQWGQRDDLIEWACALTRRTAPALAAERWWDLAVMAFLEQSSAFPFFVQTRQHVKEVHQHLLHFQERFPGDPRAALTEVVTLANAVGEGRGPMIFGPSPPGPNWDIEIFEGPEGASQAQVALRANAATRASSKVRADITSVVRGFAALAGDPVVGLEARLRLGSLEMAQPSLALTHFDVASWPESEPFLVYIGWSFRGTALIALGRNEEAERAYRAALSVVPNAESATVGLSWLLIVSGHRAEASDLVAASLMVKPPPPDPTSSFHLGDARLLPMFLAELRKAL